MEQVVLGKTSLELPDGSAALREQMIDVYANAFAYANTQAPLYLESSQNANPYWTCVAPLVPFAVVDTQRHRIWLYSHEAFNYFALGGMPRSLAAPCTYHAIAAALAIRDIALSIGKSWSISYFDRVKNKTLEYPADYEELSPVSSEPLPVGYSDSGIRLPERKERWESLVGAHVSGTLVHVPAKPGEPPFLAVDPEAVKRLQTTQTVAARQAARAAIGDFSLILPPLAE